MTQRANKSSLPRRKTAKPLLLLLLSTLHRTQKSYSPQERFLAVKKKKKQQQRRRRRSSAIGYSVLGDIGITATASARGVSITGVYERIVQQQLLIHSEERERERRKNAYIRGACAGHVRTLASAGFSIEVQQRERERDCI